MKKRSLKYILILVVIGMILGIPITIIIELFVNSGAQPPNYAGLARVAIFVGLFIGVPISLFIIKKIIWSSQRKKHEATFPAVGFIPDYTFYSSNCAFYIDLSNNKIAIVTTFNPYELQIAGIERIERAWVNDGKQLGGTRMVSFCFIIDKKTWKVFTFTADVTFSMQSNSVKEGIAKAQRVVDYILNAKNNVKENA